MSFQVSNLIRTDSYKISHWNQIPPDTKTSYAYMESRGGMFERTLMFGLSYYEKEYLQGQFIKSLDEIYEANALARSHFGMDGVFNLEGWRNLWEKHNGVLPIRIQSVPEGHVVETGNALFTVENTDPDFPWLPNWLETLLEKVWYPITVGTLSREIRQVIGKALIKTGTIDLLPFKLHDFGYRGVSSEESAAIGGMAHLVNFQGTDTQIALPYAKHFYGHPMAGFSIPAMEHTTVISWGKDFEAEAYKNMLREYPIGLVACVSDSYDLQNAVENIWGKQLRDEVIGRNGTLVVRPDSGDPLDNVLMVLETLGERFGYDSNQKGYKVLAPSVRVIQGDGINYHSILRLVNGVIAAGWSMDNLALGMGGALLQQVNRDTQRFAYKLSAIKRGELWQDVKKEPKTDLGKSSKGGRFKVSNASGKFVTIPLLRGPGLEKGMEPGDILETTFENGEIKREWNLKEIRNLAASYDSF